MASSEENLLEFVNKSTLVIKQQTFFCVLFDFEWYKPIVGWTLLIGAMRDRPLLNECGCGIASCFFFGRIMRSCSFDWGGMT